jgi:hypothetical protein
MATYGSLVVELGANVGRLQADMNRAVSVVDRSAAGMRRAASAATAALAAIGSGVALSSIIGTVREFGKLQSSLVTVTGSAQGAQAAFAWLERFAATTPFQLNEVVGAFIKLDALGLKPSEKALRSFGNTASAMGKSLDQFVEAVADASTSEFERLKEFGIKAKVDGDRVSLTFRGLTTTIQNSSVAITQYLEDIGNIEFAGAMERQAQTLDGSLSNLEDAFAGLARAIGEAGLTAAVQGAASGLTVLVNSMADAAREGEGLLRVVTGLGTGIAELVRGTDQQRLGKLLLEEIELEKELAAVRDGPAFRGNRRTRELQAIEEQLARVRREAEGLRTALQPAQFGGAPARQPIAAAPRASTETAAGPTAKQIADIERKNERLAAEFKRESDSVRAYLQDYARDREQTFQREVEQSRSRIDSLRESIRTPREQAVAELAEFERVFGSESEEYGRKAVEVFNQLETEIGNVDTAGERARTTFADLGATFSSAFEEAIFSASSFSDVLAGLGQDIARLLLRQTVTDPLAEFASNIFKTGTGGGGIGGGIGSFFSSIFGGFRANGGPVSAGRAYVVGERGPELLIPGTAGTVVPNGAGGSIVNVFNYGSEPVRTEQNGTRGIDVFVGGSVTRAASRGMLAPLGVRPPLVAR